MRVLVTGARAPVSLHLAALLTRAGHLVTAADTFRSPLFRGSPWAQAYEVHPSPVDVPEAFAGWARTMGQLHDLIIPTCEEVFWFALLAPGVPLLSPDAATLRSLHSKVDAMRLADELGIATPATIRRGGGEMEHPWHLAPEDTVLKPEFSRFATRVLVGPATLDLPEPGIAWAQQMRIRGRELSAMAICHLGEVTGFVCYASVARAGRGAGILLDPLPTRTRSGGPLLDMVTRLARATGYSGFLSIDAIETDGPSRLIEVNPRATSGLHFFRDPPSVDRALRGQGIAHPVMRPQMLGAAMLAFRGPAFLAPRAERSLRHHAEEATAFQRRAPGVWRQIETAARLWLRARRHGGGFLDAATRDIAWDGRLPGFCTDFRDALRKS